MAEPALLRLDAGLAHCAWRIGSTEGPADAGSLEAAGSALAGTRVTLLVPGTEVLLTHVNVPARNRAKARTAIPWALEDRLVTDVDDLHIALGTPNAEGDWPVAVIAHATMEEYLAAVREVGIDPLRALPEPFGLPAPEAGTWNALEAPGHVIVRTEQASGFACEPEMLTAVTAGLAPPERIARSRVEGTEAPAWPGNLEPALEAGGSPRPVADPLDAFGPDVTGIDLLQGRYSRRERSSRLLRQWRVPAGLAAVLALISLVQTGLAYHALGEREAALRARMESIFRSTFPEVQRVVNPRAQMSTRLDSLREGGSEKGFIELLADAGPVLGRAEGVTLRALNWRNERLVLELRADDLQRLDGLRKQLAGAGLDAELAQAEREGDRVQGRIQVSEAAG